MYRRHILFGSFSMRYSHSKPLSCHAFGARSTVLAKKVEHRTDGAYMAVDVQFVSFQVDVFGAAM